jgi:hypothetical protein
MGCTSQFASMPTRNWASRADAMLGIVLIFAVPLLLAGAMIDPAGLHLGGLIAYTAIVFVALPFVGWGSFLLVAAFPAAGESRSRSLLAFWIGASVTATAVTSFIASAMSYPRPGARVDLSGHLLIPFAPRAGVAIGLFALCMLVASGIVGGVAPLLRPEVAIRSVVIGGGALFLVLYGAGWLLAAG